MGFKVGDRVRYTFDGDEGPITSISASWVTVDFNVDGRTTVLEEEIELVESVPEEEEPLAPWEKELLWTPFEQSVRRHTDRIAELLVEKNKQYSNSALDPIRVFSKAGRTEQLRVRADDKLSRIRNGDTSEDAVLDLCGYLILLRIAAESE